MDTSDLLNSKMLHVCCTPGPLLSEEAPWLDDASGWFDGYRPSATKPATPARTRDGRVVEDGRVRIGTWNLAGRWGAHHLELVLSLDCDILLLTEVSTRVSLPGYCLHPTAGLMARGRYWAAVGAWTDLRPLPDPHGASAMAEVGGVRVCASILPWRTCGACEPWVGTSSEEKTAEAVAAVEAAGPMVWGGDWNHGLVGTEGAGSIGGRQRIISAVDRLGLVVPTEYLPHRLPRRYAIDHVAVPNTWEIVAAERVSGVVGGVALSDHDAYVVTGSPVARPQS